MYGLTGIIYVVEQNVQVMCTHKQSIKPSLSRFNFKHHLGPKYESITSVGKVTLEI